MIVRIIDAWNNRCTMQVDRLRLGARQAGDVGGGPGRDYAFTPNRQSLDLQLLGVAGEYVGVDQNGVRSFLRIPSFLTAKQDNNNTASIPP